MPWQHRKEVPPLRDWLVCRQAFLLEQALGPNALLAVQPGRLRLEPYQLVPVLRAIRIREPCRYDRGMDPNAPCPVHFLTPAGPVLVQASAEDTVVRAAARAGLAIPTQCRHGFCATCEVHVQTGPQRRALRACVELVEPGMAVILTHC
ncbi:MAG: 2Fe-2S iron-sulfur cluster binding domain-containing protein [Aphanocapsa lilacina HA4352-LM1]|nr:2Fe-2S iron-sulfur cluster binding domain-containing protein [Aphanocapsa lilacina HA4352-LM1]